MPPKVRTLISQLLSAGFQERGGKGSHRNFRHPSGANITMSGKPGDDAKHYQIRDVALAIKQVQHEK
jgi:predicted RNA binding protein YcfA (HicA-like mRNA interferase family)